MLLVGCSSDGLTGREDEDDPDSDTGAVEVVTSTSGVAIDPDGYTVRTDGDVRTMGANSRMTISGLSPGIHIMELSGVAANCTLSGDNPRSVTVTAGGTTQTTFAVGCPASGALFVMVTSADVPLGGATVVVTGSTTQHSGITASDGWVRFGSVKPGTFTVTATVAGEPCSSQSATVTSRQTTEIALTCATGIVRGQVTVNGVGEAGVIVGMFTVTTMTDPDGRYEFMPFLPGPWRVGIVPPSGATCPTTFHDILLPPGATLTVDFACTR
jgi:hypothetical protein